MALLDVQDRPTQISLREDDRAFLVPDASGLHARPVDSIVVHYRSHIPGLTFACGGAYKMVAGVRCAKVNTALFLTVGVAMQPLPRVEDATMPEQHPQDDRRCCDDRRRQLLERARPAARFPREMSVDC